MKVRILGPFDVMVNGTSILPTAGKPRQILALLSLHAGSMVSMPTLMDELWGAEPPQSALTTLQTYVSQLRRRLDAAPGPDTPRPARDVLVTCQGGYVLRILGMERRRLEVARLVAVERRIDVDLRLGRHNELLAELAGLVTHHPLHEGLHSQAMVALYRSGRRAAAIGVYRRLRRLLVGRLGVEPAPQLQRLHQAILTVDPALNVAAGPRHTPTFDLYPA
uniref:Lct21 n=1 Tax=Streptomyces rishiriensis TaxID=68264 RepID=B0LJ04_STRRH|nr:Lct21 [Streptomyces rishiriensis]